MALAPGTRLGAYEILTLIGSGGMGEVYRAHDARLKRDVAIKVLPEALSTDPDRIARFQREAELLATLNHPHIAAVYGVEDADAVRAIVLELVEGQTLAETLARGALPLDDALAVARQLVNALEAAHDRGIIHRDLKPANIKITPDGTTKVLDFGLAKMAEREATASSLSLSPTLSVQGTYAGVILGTAAYMSPEQARGKPVDRKTDIWAFGCVLYEMLCGKQAFDAGETVSDAVAAILRSDIDWSALPAHTPPHVVKLLHRCLQKDPQKRLPHIGVARLDLDDPAGHISPAVALSTPSRPRRLWRGAGLGAIVVATAALAAVGAWWLKPTHPASVVRFAIPFPEGRNLSSPVRSEIAVSPDGSLVVFEAGRQLYVRSLADSTVHPIAGAMVPQGAIGNPTFSPNGRSIAYHVQGAIKRIPVGGGTPVTVCEIDPTTPYGITWDASGILYAQGQAIMRVSATGGVPQVLTPLKLGEIAHAPQLLPDGQTVLFSVTSGGVTTGRFQVVVQSLKTAARKVIVDDATEARYTPTGHLLYVRRAVLFAVPFDVGRLETTGGVTAMLEGVRTDGSTAHYAISSAGTLVYVPGPAAGELGQLEIALFDRQGRAEVLKLPAGPYETPRVSPDGRYLAVGVGDQREQNVWLYAMSGTSSLRRLTFGGRNRYPVWSADSRRVTFQSDREGDHGIFWQTADGATTAERVTRPKPNESHVPDAWAPDGRHLLFDIIGQDGEVSLWLLTSTDGKVSPFPVAAARNPFNAIFSPDGRWVAYQSAETGTMQVFVQPFPTTGAKYQLTKTTTSSHYPLWTHDGREMLLVPGRGMFSVMAVTNAPTFSVADPTPLARGRFYEGGPSFARSYDLAPDGRIIAPSFPQSSETINASRIDVVVNWFDELKQRVAAP